MELPLMVAVPTTAAAERMGTGAPNRSMRYWSMSMVPQPARHTRIKVRSPAEWRLLERSQPMMADSVTLSASRNSTPGRVRPVLHSPKRAPIQSFSICITSALRNSAAEAGCVQSAPPRPP